MENADRQLMLQPVTALAAETTAALSGAQQLYTLRGQLQCRLQYARRCRRKIELDFHKLYGTHQEEWGRVYELCASTEVATREFLLECEPCLAAAHDRARILTDATPESASADVLVSLQELLTECLPIMTDELSRTAEATEVIRQSWHSLLLEDAESME